MNFEQIYVEVTINSFKSIVCADYILPNSLPVNLSFPLSHLSIIKPLESTYPNGKCLICGDINISSLGSLGFKCTNCLSSYQGSTIIEGFSFYIFSNLIILPVVIKLGEWGYIPHIFFQILSSYSKEYIYFTKMSSFSLSYI